jgi:hypothetical protein
MADEKVVGLEDGKLKVKTIQDDNLEFDTFGDFPLVGKEGVYYFDLEKSEKHYWNGTQYKPVTIRKFGDDIEITDSTKGLILTSPDGGKWRLTVDNNGLLITTKIN